VQASEPGRAPIRPARPSDAERIAEIAVAGYSKYLTRMAGVRPAPLDADYTELVGRGIVSVIDDEPVPAFIILLAEPDHLWVDNLAVDPALQGRGIGKRLLAFAEDEARRLGFVELRLLTSVKMTENLALYASLGYVEYDRRDEENRQRAYLRKRLGGTGP
jgi:GNAT superfamily N-acetyltransferase